MRHDARKIDRVDGHQLITLRQETLIVEGILHNLLAVIEITFHSKIVDVVTLHRGHLPALYFRNALMRMQNKQIDVLAMFATFQRCGTRIAGGGTQDGHMLLALFQEMVEQTAQQLQCKVLEG